MCVFPRDQHIGILIPFEPALSATCLICFGHGEVIMNALQVQLSVNILSHLTHSQLTALTIDC